MRSRMNSRVSKETFQKLFLLYLLSKYQKGIYGDFRLQKVIYSFERNNKLRPYTFIRYNLGPYSKELDKIKDQLLYTGWILPKDVGRTSSYVPNTRKEVLQKIEEVLESSFENLEGSVFRFVSKEGYQKSLILKEKAYSDEIFVSKKMGEIIFESNLPEIIQLCNLSNGEAEDLELAFNPDFISTLRYRLSQIVKAKTPPNWREQLAAVCS